MAVTARWSRHQVGIQCKIRKSVALHVIMRWSLFGDGRQRGFTVYRRLVINVGLFYLQQYTSVVQH